VGSALRVVFQFHERFWSSERFARRRHVAELDTMSFLHGDEKDFPTWWTAYPIASPILVSWCGGTRARELSRLPRAEIVERALDALARQLGVARGRLHARMKTVWAHDWENDPFALGAYSYQVVGGMDGPAVLARPIHRTLFFAGEATDSSGATGTVHGAIATGRRAAAQVMRAIGRR
jgi:monoamine oxidase